MNVHHKHIHHTYIYACKAHFETNKNSNDECWFKSWYPAWKSGQELADLKLPNDVQMDLYTWEYIGAGFICELQPILNIPMCKDTLFS